ncbi:hypothetical protein RVN83_36530 [Streptomyces sp. PU10]|uniref:hypothetical protein n=1 Tax=Streptomyces sp. PU10 TaxID=3062780 RepID=UPI0028FC3AB4|nr:hypothetical protein [Streptomyces sp. PU10]MDU0258435.1 hypothetical protein [Streptomyces sp. PU10]
MTSLAQLLCCSGRRHSRRVVEPGMTITASGVAAADIKATGSVASALIGRYRPAGEPRPGGGVPKAA